MKRTRTKKIRGTVKEVDLEAPKLEREKRLKERQRRSRIRKNGGVVLAESDEYKGVNARMTKKQESRIVKKLRTKWKPEFLNIIYHMALLGAKEADICEALGVRSSSMAVWKRTRAEVKEVLQRGRLQADARVAQSLYHAGTGYSHPETKIIPNRVKTFDENGKLISDELKIERVDVIKHYPPNVTAAVKWLNSRHPELWGDKANELNAQVVNINTINFSDFSNQELEVLTKMGYKQKGLDIPAQIGIQERQIADGAEVLPVENIEDVEFVDDGE